MFCQSCGMEVASTYKMCPKCGGRQFDATMHEGAPSKPILTPQPPPAGIAKVAPGGAGHAVGIQSMNKTSFASFWRRFGALMIDGLLLGAIQLIWLAPAMAGAALSESTEAMASAMGIMQIIGVIIGLIYFPLMHSSQYQATLGKKWLGIKVVDTNGQRISIARGFGRYFASFLSYITLYIGFLMVFFTKRRQALHDKLAGTYVVYIGR